MGVYDKMPGKTNIYRLNKRLVAARNVPLAITELLKIYDSVDEDNLPEEEKIVKFKQCLFCEEHGNYHRMVNLQTVDLCRDHYYSENIGKIAQKLNGN